MTNELSPDPRRILLIEDEEAHVSIIERSFEREGGFQLTVASTVAEAAQAVEIHAFDLVIADWLLPDGEVFDILKDGHPLPVLIMTSHGNEKVAVRAIKAGALDYVVKSENSMLDMPRIAEGAMRMWENVRAKELAQLQLRRALDEKILLLKEIHHRVKNNFAVVTVLLSMQIQREADNARPTEALNEARSRVAAMAAIHEQIYKSETIAALDFGDYATEVSNRLFDAYCVDKSRIKIELDIQPIHLALADAVPFGLILNELLSNSLKHAFTDGRTGVIRVALEQTGGGGVELIVSDNGVGLPADFQIEGSKSLGLQVVGALTHQLEADLTFGAGNPGTTFKLKCKLPQESYAARA